MAQSKPAVENLFQNEIYLEAILRQQAQQMVGRPGWPDTVAAIYQCLLNQIEADVSAGPCPR
ncbi:MULTISPECIES: hypothetical protein [Hymenobacter]|uniref:Uncharacterized protein n=2 Tax=Hymenobacter TaxID=89966 RepID=A0ABS6WXP4_9BACT|nr:MULTISPECIES: hypothetical protein [Hymenobacter]MBO3269269.1 hypothetical protein [Hymenobacter defluvii]MBW3128362.1 hypothetical protein [Hymenobacter profundi]QNE38912.1 hypothetical protein F1C16_04735 [Hymenobacter sp. NBH84]